MRYHDVAIAYHFGDWPTHASAQRALLKSIDAWSPSAVFEIEDNYDGYVHIASVEAGILADRWYHVWQFKSNDAKNVLVIIKQCHTVVIHCELSAAREDISASFRLPGGGVFAKDSFRGGDVDLWDNRLLVEHDVWSSAARCAIDFGYVEAGTDTVSLVVDGYLSPLPEFTLLWHFGLCEEPPRKRLRCKANVADALLKNWLRHLHGKTMQELEDQYDAESFDVFRVMDRVLF